MRRSLLGEKFSCFLTTPTPRQATDVQRLGSYDLMALYKSVYYYCYFFTPGSIKTRSYCYYFIIIFFTLGSIMIPRDDQNQIGYKILEN